MFWRGGVGLSLTRRICLAADSAGRIEQRAPPIFGRAAITLGIGLHSSSDKALILTSGLASSFLHPHPPLDSWWKRHCSLYVSLQYQYQTVLCMYFSESIAAVSHGSSCSAWWPSVITSRSPAAQLFRSW